MAAVSFSSSSHAPSYSMLSEEPPNTSQPPSTWLSPNRGAKLLLHPLPKSPSKLSYPSKLPDWYSNLHRQLRDLSCSNQEEPTHPLDYKSIRATVEHVMGIQDDNQSLLLLKLLSEFPLFGSQEIFFCVLNALRQRHSNLNTYFSDLDLEEDGIHPSFTPAALAQLLHFFCEQFRLPDVLDVTYTSALPSLVLEMIKAPEGTFHGWAVANDLISDDPHVVPAFALKKGGVLHLFFFDSIGHNFSENMNERRIPIVLTQVFDELRNKEKAREGLKIYSYQPQRQHALAGCTVFTLLDLKNLVEMHQASNGDLIDFYHSQPPELQPEVANHKLRRKTPLDFYEMRTLPPQMMKSTQSYTELGRYQSRPPEMMSTPMAFRYSAEGELVSKPLNLEELRLRVEEKKRIDSRDKPKNLYVEQKQMQMTVYLLGVYFGMPAIDPKNIFTPNMARRLF